MSNCATFLDTSLVIFIPSKMQFDDLKLILRNSSVKYFTMRGFEPLIRFSCLCFNEFQNANDDDSSIVVLTKNLNHFNRKTCSVE